MAIMYIGWLLAFVYFHRVSMDHVLVACLVLRDGLLFIYLFYLMLYQVELRLERTQPLELSCGQCDPPCRGQRPIRMAMPQLSRSLQIVLSIDRFSLRHTSNTYGSGNKFQYIHTYTI